MTNRPILFSPAMVAAILGGRKTQTRRVVLTKEEIDKGPWTGDVRLHHSAGWQVRVKKYNMWRNLDVRIETGDRLWVRETWGTGTRPCPVEGWRDGIEYKADSIGLDEGELLPLHDVSWPDDNCSLDYPSGWRPSIHMPRRFSRLTLLVQDVRVERLQDISEDDAMAEGVDGLDVPRCGTTPVSGRRGVFADLWQSLNAHGS